MKSFLIQREIEVDLVDITNDDLSIMSPGQIESFAHATIKYLGDSDAPAATIPVFHNRGQASIQLEPELSESCIADDYDTQAEPETPINPQARMLGKKVGKTSIYSYVYLVGKSGLFTSGITSKRKKHMCGSHIKEVNAALAIDAYLDEIGDDTRPRNRDHHPEIMDLYLQKHKDIT